MIAVFLLPFPFRGYRAPHLFVFYRFLTTFDERALFIVSEDYLTSPEVWTAQGRWEMKEQNQIRLGYKIPSWDTMQLQQYSFLDETLFDALLQQNGGNPIAAFRCLLLERIPQLEARFATCLDDVVNSGVEAILTWCNCPSLNAVARARGIPVVNLELGPLRLPEYRPTAYLDFEGVNGNTEAERRYRESSFSYNGTINQLRKFFILEADRSRLSPAEAIGVVLQVEDDSNLIAYGHGFDNQSLITFSNLRFPKEKLLVRPHPGSLFDLKDGLSTVDRSSSSIDFVLRCSQILTVNSSVGLEALLHGIPVTALGDCSFSHIVEAETESERVSRMAYYLFAYLVPMDLIFDASYLRMRLAKPSDTAVVARHLAQYLGLGDSTTFFDGATSAESISIALERAGCPDG